MSSASDIALVVEGCPPISSKSKEPSLQDFLPPLPVQYKILHLLMISIFLETRLDL